MVLAQDGGMDRASYLDSLRGDAADLLTAAGGQLDADVPTCPGWKMERLVGHVGREHRDRVLEAPQAVLGAGEHVLQ